MKNEPYVETLYDRLELDETATSEVCLTTAEAIASNNVADPVYASIQVK